MPAVPVGLNTPQFSVQSSLFGPRRLILVLVTVSILLLVIFFIMDGDFQSGGRINSPELDLEGLTYPTDGWKSKVLDDFDAAKVQQDDNKRFELYQNIFFNLLSFYQTNHEAKIRVEVEKLSQFIKSEFANQVADTSYTVPCLDLGCGSPTYPPEIAEIDNEITQISVIDSQVADGISKKLQAAALSPDPNFQWSRYLEVFNLLVAEKRRTENAQVKGLAEKLRAYLEKNYSSQYQDLKNALPEIFNI